MIRLALVLWILGATCLAGGLIAHADPDLDADRAFQAALRRHGDAVALDAFEQLGAARPITRWTDDAWAEAARLAERAGDYARARRDLGQVIAIGTDEVLVRRAKATLERLAASTGGGAWDAIARDHERLAERILGGGDPRVALAELEQLAQGNPEYPQVASAWIVVAQGWEREGDGGLALDDLRRAIAAAPRGAQTRNRLGMTFARIAIRKGELDAAGAELDALAAGAGADQFAIAEVRERLEIAKHRETVRHVLWIVLALIAAAALVAVRRDAGSWRASGRALAKPPIEVLFLLPIGGVLIAVSRTGNPLVARALLAIVIAGIVVAWLSGALLEARRSRHRITARRAVLQAALAVTAIGAASYLAVDRDRMLDLVSETWEHGPAPR